ncbi:MAG: LPXTG cell wall anchor domain-containing protein, partial [Clostridiales bacterium]|nr:LPXTG cell wall anchor domain-containing protein [Clostridiales bacterium]
KPSTAASPTPAPPAPPYSPPGGGASIYASPTPTPEPSPALAEATPRPAEIPIPIELDQGSIAEPIAPAPAPDPLGSGVLGESGLDKPDESVKVVVSDKVPDLAKTGGMITYSAPIAFGLALLSIAFLSTFIKREEKPKG